MTIYLWFWLLAYRQGWVTMIPFNTTTHLTACAHLFIVLSSAFDLLIFKLKQMSINHFILNCIIPLWKTETSMSVLSVPFWNPDQSTDELHRVSSVHRLFLYYTQINVVKCSFPCTHFFVFLEGMVMPCLLHKDLGPSAHCPKRVLWSGVMSNISF